MVFIFFDLHAVNMVNCTDCISSRALCHSSGKRLTGKRPNGKRGSAPLKVQQDESKCAMESFLPEQSELVLFTGKLAVFVQQTQFYVFEVRKLFEGPGGRDGRLGRQHFVGDPLDVFVGNPIDLLDVMLSRVAVALSHHLSRQVLEDDRSAFQIHQQHGLQLFLGPVQFVLPDAVGHRQSVELGQKDLSQLGQHLRRRAGVYAKDAAVSVSVVERRGGVHPMVMVQDIGIQPRVHAFAGTSGGKRPTSAHQHVEHAKGDEIGVLMGNAFQTNRHMGQFRKRGRSQTSVGQVFFLSDQSTGVLSRRAVRFSSLLAVPNRLGFDKIFLGKNKKLTICSEFP